MLQQSSPRLVKNNFDFLRLFFAISVLLVHAHYLSNFQQLSIIVSVLSSTTAVKGFFVVSGFLIFMSYERSESVAIYTKKRMKRIYPAYFVVVMLSAISLIVISLNNVEEYFTLTWIKYVIANLTFLNFLQPTLPGVFDSNKLTAVNGALWTLKIEVMFYFTVPLFVFLIRKFALLPILIIFYCLSVFYVELLQSVAEHTNSDIYLMLARQLPGQLSYFLAGAFLYYYLPLFEKHIGYFISAAAFVLCINNFFPLPILEPFALAVVVVFFGLFLYLGNFGKYGDFSYGIYILHFPIIQLLLHSGYFRENPWCFLISVLIVTMCGAMILWHFVEKRFLLRKNHYISSLSKNETTLPNHH